MVDTNIETGDIAAVAPAAVKLGTKVFIYKARKLWGILYDNHGGSRIVQLCEKLPAPEYLIDNFPSFVGGYACYIGEGPTLFPNPKRIFKIWRITFRGCLHMSGGNQIASCLLATVVTGVSLFPRYKFHSKLIVSAQAFIRMAYSAVKPIDKVIEDAEFVQFILKDGYGQI